jgi:predicted nucleic acid-binding protein
MARIIVLDSGPLGLVCHRPEIPQVQAINDWEYQLRINGAFLYVPEIADYEVRRKLIQTQRMAALKRLNAYRENFGVFYAPIKTDAMLKAAELWADARRRGEPTASDDRLDADAILAAQALQLVGRDDVLTVATKNVRHLSRFGLDAQPWEAITP